VWDAIERWPDYFAAAVPVAGAGDPSHAAELAHVPIWDFHGADDTNVPVSGSRAMIQAIQSAGGSPRYTEFVGATHTIWMQVYGDSAMLEWLFAQSNPSAAAHRTPRHMT
jgi:predicted peptidase